MKAGSHPLDEGLLAGNLIVPQVQVSALGSHGHSGGVRGMPLQAGDPAVERAGGAVEVVRRQRADKRLLQTLQREEWSWMSVLQEDLRKNGRVLVRYASRTNCQNVASHVDG